MQKVYNYRDPKWSFNTNDVKHKSFLDAIHSLQVILNDTVSLEHGYIEHKKNKNNEDVELFREFQPTTFIYSFFVFNILYNYDWQKSFQEKKLITYESLKITKHERDKIEKFTNFCLENPVFALEYTKRFQTILNYEFSIDEIEKAIYTITPDSRITEESKDAFINSIERIMEEGEHKTFKEDVCDCLKFIYDIRCNVLHGTKTLKEIIDNEVECTKLKIYSWFIIASCQMLFSYLDYKEVPYYRLYSIATCTSSFKKLFDNLQM